MRIGTSYFESLRSAIKYYHEYHYADTKKAVERKLKCGEIHIGKPTIKDGDRLYINEDGRYFIQTKEK